MLVTLLTKSGGPLGPFAYVFGIIMNGIYEFFHLFGIQNIALSVIVFTFITKAILLPFTIKQQKFTKLSSKMSPELQRIQAKYKGKKDEASLRKQQTETQAVYEKYGASPTAGCLPLLIQLPIMFSLYRVINNIPAYVTEIKNLYLVIAEAVQKQPDFASKLSELATTVGVKVTEFPDSNKVIDVLAKFKTENWNQLAQSFPDIQGTLDAVVPNIHRVNEFFSLNIADAPGWGFPGILIPILAMTLQFIQGKQLEVKNKENNKDNPTASAMSSMNVVMPIMSGFFCVTFPIGIGIYWIASSAFAIIQQFFVNKYMDRIDVDELIKNNLSKQSKRKKYAEAAGVSLEDLAKKQTRSIDSVAKINTNTKTDDEDDVMTQETERKSQQTNNPGSISEIANLLKNRNSDKGDK